MVEVTMQEIQELRAKTNCGIMDCKKALKDANGDMEAAVDVLRKKGMAKAATRSDRKATEGVVKIELSADNKTAYMLQLCSETDFVSRNEKFQGLATEILVAMKKSKGASEIEDIKNLVLASGHTVAQEVEELSGVIGEKIELTNAKVINSEKDQVLGYYVHSNQKIGVVLIVNEGDDTFVKQLCMHIAASAPVYISKDEVPSEELSRERDVLKEQVINEGKPEAVADKIVEGKLRKYFEEICLMEQKFVIDTDKKISDVLGKTKIIKFIRFSIG
ncbi:MAG: translation elongation factor Ts [Candidatus Margulisbacteria bacterium]|nr:translation elongation factor Ts [Candidatus Margulisiibacteriota bacterium]